MRRTELLQGLRLMKFEEVYGRTCRGALCQAEAAEILGVSERRAPVDEVMQVLELFDTRYWDFTAKHFHEKLVADHGCMRSYNWVRLTLQAHGRKQAAGRTGASGNGVPCPA